MRIRRTFFPVIIAVALVLVAGCSIPDYQLDFTAYVSNYTSNPVTVSYTLYNAGSKDLYNVSAEVQVDAVLSTGGTTAGTAWTGMRDIDAGSEVSGTMSILLASGTSYSSATAYMVSAQWDSEDGGLF